MTFRRDALALSSILFTLALLIPTPAMLGNAWTARHPRLDIAGVMGSPNYYAPIGFASLAIIVIGLIVIWTGYIGSVRWTWFVMFLIACGWAFPVLVLAEFHWRNMLPIAQWPPMVSTVRGPQLGFAGSILTLVIMVFALVLSFKILATRRRGISRDENRARDWDLKIRLDAAAFSSILFTVALLLLTPNMIGNAMVTHESRLRDIAAYPRAGIAWDQVVIPNHLAPLGITSLSIIAIGLVVTWAGYIKGVRWAWFVMFAIVWMWALPVLVLPNFRPWGGPALISPSAFASMIRDSLQAGPFTFIARIILETLLIFLLMVLALVLPLKTFILGWRSPKLPEQKTNTIAA